MSKSGYNYRPMMYISLVFTLGLAFLVLVVPDPRFEESDAPIVQRNFDVVFEDWVMPPRACKIIYSVGATALPISKRHRKYSVVLWPGAEIDVEMPKFAKIDGVKSVTKEVTRKFFSKFDRAARDQITEDQCAGRQ